MPLLLSDIVLIVATFQIWLLCMMVNPHRQSFKAVQTGTHSDEKAFYAGEVVIKG